MMPCRGMGAIAPSKMPKGTRRARRDDTDFTEYAEGGEVLPDESKERRYALADKYRKSEAEAKAGFIPDKANAIEQPKLERLLAAASRSPRSAQASRDAYDRLQNMREEEIEDLGKRQGYKDSYYKEGGKVKNWIKGAIKHKGALHEELGVPEGKKIPAKKLAAAAKKPGKIGKRARLAETLRGMK